MCRKAPRHGRGHFRNVRERRRPLAPGARPLRLERARLAWLLPDLRIERLLRLQPPPRAHLHRAPDLRRSCRVSQLASTTTATRNSAGYTLTKSSPTPVPREIEPLNLTAVRSQAAEESSAMGQASGPPCPRSRGCRQDGLAHGLKRLAGCPGRVLGLDGLRASSSPRPTPGHSGVSTSNVPRGTFEHESGADMTPGCQRLLCRCIEYRIAPNIAQTSTMAHS